MAADGRGTPWPDGGVATDEAGGLRLTGPARDLFDAIDRVFERLAVDAGAEPVAAADTVDRGLLERAGYFEAFPDFAIPADGGGRRFLPPAACYQIYPALRGARLDAPRLFTLAVPCGRREERAADDAGRLHRFTMREVVFVGAPEWVAAERWSWMAHVKALAADWGLTAALEPATDTFFGGGGRGRRLLQQLKQLKHELRADAGSAGRLALASFNLHESFFSSRFDLAMADGSPAATGCAAFGLERWTLACLAQLGADRAAAAVAGAMEVGHDLR